MQAPDPELCSILGFAQRLLLAETAQEKLTPIQVSDDAFYDPSQRSQWTAIERPKRPAEWQFQPQQKKSAQTLFPTARLFEQDQARGQVLHYFANHELLAIELMALALLRFKDFDRSFLLGIVRTIAEEQTHMNLYIHRMGELGVRFGQYPMNLFFWNSLKQMNSPLDYLAGLSLTFEQANLDFSKHFHDEFLRLGDHETATLLHTVYRDEIGHVKFGVTWMNRLKSPQESLWESYLKHLQFPLTPMRAKAKYFDLHARREAGLKDDFINELRIFNSSKGRPPNVYWFNGGCEESFLTANLTKKFQQPKLARAIQQDLAMTMAYLGHSDDVLLLERMPSKQWLSQLAHLGIKIPELVTFQTLHLLGNRKLGHLRPWGQAPDALDIANQLRPLQAPSFMTKVNIEDRDPCKLLKTCYSKSFAAGLRSNEDLPGIIADSVHACSEAIKSFFGQHPQRPIIIKSNFGSSGRHTKKIRSLEDLSDSKLHIWIHQQLITHKSLVVEPWVDRICDLSLQFEVTSEGHCRIHGVTRFLVSPKGQYIGHQFGKLLAGLPTEVHQLWHGSQPSADGQIPSSSWLQRFKDTAEICSKALFERGHRGPAGIDGFIYNDGGTYKFQSLSEINPRYTMGRVALSIQSLLFPKTPALWLHISKRMLENLGCKSFSDLIADLNQKMPLKLAPSPSSQTLIQSGCLATTDPEAAEIIFPVLIVADESYLKKFLGKATLSI
jgi:uncharacterized ferritin-like protein (DUF455 family)